MGKLCCSSPTRKSWRHISTVLLWNWCFQHLQPHTDVSIFAKLLNDCWMKPMVFDTLNHLETGKCCEDPIHIVIWLQYQGNILVRVFAFKFREIFHLYYMRSDICLFDSVLTFLRTYEKSNIMTMETWTCS